MKQGLQMKLHKKQKIAIDLALDLNIKSLLIMGEGGTGKSTIIHKINKSYNSEVVILAPTQTASQNLNGHTLHSFGKAFKALNKEADMEDNANHFVIRNLDIDSLAQIYPDANTLFIIDEVSMVGATIFNKIIRPLMNAYRVVLLGDPHQLPPIGDHKIDFEKVVNVTVTLTKNFRINSKKVKQVVNFYREYGYKSTKVKTLTKFRADTTYIAYSNKALSELQFRMLGYTDLKVGDKASIFGNLYNKGDERIAVNGSLVTVKGVVKDKYRILTYIDELTTTQIESYLSYVTINNVTVKGRKGLVFSGDYNQYKMLLRVLYNLAKEFNKKYYELAITQRPLYHEVVKAYWSNYNKVKSIPYARHSNFTTTYKVQGKSLDKVALLWEEIPQHHRYTALSRAINKIYFL